jgi:hypothetical protein
MSGRFLPWPSFQVDVEDMASDHRTQAQTATWWIPFLRGGKTPTPERKGPWQSRSVASRQTVRWSPGSSRCSRLASLLCPSRPRLTPSSRRSQRRRRRWPPHPIDSQEWRKWTNWEPYPLRHGVALDQMSPSQRDAARELLRVSLSVRGFETARHVMKRNEVLGEITGN